MKKDTIVAISTAMQPAAIAVVRLSGTDSVAITDKVFKGSKPLSEAFSHTVNYGFIFDGEEKVDEVLVSRMDGPRTYTGEDTVEINCHGSLLIQRKILSLLIENGARQAKPGEFTMRAFLNGKLDLVQAESVMDVIMSESDSILNNSLNQLSGSFSTLIEEIRNDLKYDLAYIEAALDDPEHMSLDGFDKRLSETVNSSRRRINRLAGTYNYGEILKHGIDVAIIGKTNVGKSSLLNSLCGNDVAIVSDIPGTTRDSITKRINLGGIVINIIDTAGLRNAKDEIESIGIEKSKKHLEQAQLILYVLDGSTKLSEEDQKMIKELESKDVVFIINKSDLENKINAEDIKKLSSKPVVKLSAKTLDGMDILEKTIEDLYFSDQIKANSGSIVTNERHYRLLKETDNSLELLDNAIKDGMPEDILAIDLMDAYTYLGKIIGQEVEEDIINEIFSKFCVGK